MDTKILVLDLETTMRCPVGNNKANPMWFGNEIIAAGFLDVPSGLYHYKYDKKHVDEQDVRAYTAKADLVVGHNIKFDLLYVYRRALLEKLPRIWDTQLAAYILSGQRHMYASLDELTADYVGKHALKDDAIKAYWNAGVATEDIPSEELLDYMKNDVLNTSIIFEKQFAEAESLGLLPLMFVQMDALRATIQMNLYGMYVDWNYVTDQRDKYADIIVNLDGSLKAIAGHVDYASPKQVSLYLFGGEYKEKVKVDAGFYKNGNPKTKMVEVVKKVDGLYKPMGELGKSGYYSVDDAVLSELDKKGCVFSGFLLEYRKASKIKETYYEGLIGLRFPSNFIFPNLNHCATKTGRLSATNPNLQNQTDAGDVKRAYISRWAGGKILELDYSQLEMVALAYISDDKQLIDDINNGRDMHRELYKGMYGRYPTDKERKPFKRFSFLLVYGGGASTLMAQSGCDRATAKKFIDTFYSRYKGVKRYHEQIVKQAESNAVVEYVEDKPNPKYTYYHESPTGRHYVFNKYPNDRGGESFSPTELKNWPIQGFATGDVVPMSVGLLLRALEDADLHTKACLVMTVHDSVVLDVQEDVLYDVAVLAKNVLENAPANLKKYFGIDFPCKLSVGVEAGANWQDKETIDL